MKWSRSSCSVAPGGRQQSGDVTSFFGTGEGWRADVSLQIFPVAFASFAEGLTARLCARRSPPPLSAHYGTAPLALPSFSSAASHINQRA